MQNKHNMAHLGIRKTKARVMLDWYWPRMTADIRPLVLRCQVCQQTKTVNSKTAGERQHLYVGRPWQQVSIDLCGPLPETDRRNTQILVLSDHFTCWVDAIPIHDGRAETIAAALDERVFQYFGVPETIHSDCGPQFEAQLFKEVCRLWGADRTRTTPYRP